MVHLPRFDGSIFWGLKLAGPAFPVVTRIPPHFSHENPHDLRSWKSSLVWCVCVLSIGVLVGGDWNHGILWFNGD